MCYYLTMKKILFIIFILLVQLPVSAINFGAYKPETDYGLIDGFKWNLFNRKEGQPVVQIRSEIEEERIKLEKEKAEPQSDYKEIQQYRFMLDNVNTF